MGKLRYNALKVFSRVTSNKDILSSFVSSAPGLLPAIALLFLDEHPLVQNVSLTIGASVAKYRPASALKTKLFLAHAILVAGDDYATILHDHGCTIRKNVLVSTQNSTGEVAPETIKAVSRAASAIASSFFFSIACRGKGVGSL
jgi:hypothetical protein